MMKSLQNLLLYSTAVGMEKGDWTHLDTATISNSKCFFKDGGIQVSLVTAKKKQSSRRHGAITPASASCYGW